MLSRVKEWTAALRSGEFKQTRYVLKNDMGYCCLGVLCEVYARHNPGAEFLDLVEEEEGCEDHAPFRTPDGEILGSTINDEVRNWIGIDGFLASKLMGMNDAQGKSFEEIADFIDSKFKEEDHARE